MSELESKDTGVDTPTLPVQPLDTPIASRVAYVGELLSVNTCTICEHARPIDDFCGLPCKHLMCWWCVDTMLMSLKDHCCPYCQRPTGLTRELYTCHTMDKVDPRVDPEQKLQECLKRYPATSADIKQFKYWLSRIPTQTWKVHRPNCLTISSVAIHLLDFDLLKQCAVHDALDIPDHEGNYPLQQATRRDVSARVFVNRPRLSVEMLSWLLQQPNNHINERVRPWNEHPLKVSVGMGCEHMDLMIQAGADLEQENSQGLTALHEAVRLGATECVQSLLKAGANIRHVDLSRTSPLASACAYGRVNSVKLLLEHKADVNHANSRGETSLLMACRNGHVECAELLIKHGAKVNKPDNHSRSALFWAAFTGRLECAQLLIQSKADLHQLSKDGETPLAMAKQYGHNDIVGLLQRAGARK